MVKHVSQVPHHPNVNVIGVLAEVVAAQMDGIGGITHVEDFKTGIGLAT